MVKLIFVFENGEWRNYFFFLLVIILENELTCIYFRCHFRVEDAEDIESKLHKRFGNKENHLVCMCRSGARSMAAAELMRCVSRGVFVDCHVYITRSV